MSRPAGLYALLALGLAAGLLGPPPSTAAVPHPVVVREEPRAGTPQLGPTDAVPHPAVYALEQAGRTMYVGGKYAALQNARQSQTYARRGLAAFDVDTGTVSTRFLPRLNGDVWAVRAFGSSVYVGGTFTNVDGLSRPGVAKLDAVTGRLDPTFSATSVRGSITDMQIVDGRLIVGGQFAKRLAALDLVTGRDTGYLDLKIAGKSNEGAGATAVYRFAVAAGELVAIGNVGTVNGQVSKRAFMVDLGAARATLAPWYYPHLQKSCRLILKLPSYLRDVDFSPDGSWFVLVSTGGVPQQGDGGLTVCDAAARFETRIASQDKPTWINYTGGDTLHSVAVTGAAVYVQGHQRWLDNKGGRDFCVPGCAPREGIGAIHPDTGRALAWNPTKTRAVGGRELYATSEGLWVGSDGKYFNGQRRYGIAFVPLS